MWRWASASVIGTSHIQSNSRRQDASAISTITNRHLFAVVSDGAGSAQYGAYGAWLACRCLTVRFRQWFQNNQELPDDSVLREWIDNLRDQISAIASRRESTPRQFASTLAALLIAPDEVLSMHVGDSAIVARREGNWDVLCWPENGQYASSTYFITDDPAPRLTIQRHPQVYDAFALFSDGVGDLALSFITQSAHPPFLEPMLRPVDAANGRGRLVDLSGMLAQYLAGQAVCDRTDDDKTLILISGR